MRSSHKKNICRTINEQGGDYFFVIKDNQKSRRKEIADYFNVHEKNPVKQTDAEHGRVETRKIWVLETPWYIDHWPQCKHLCKIERTRYHKGKESLEVAFAITSLGKEHAKPESLLKLWRDHWKIENQLHWRKDVEFEEDRSTVRAGRGPEFFSWLRNTTIAILSKGSKKLKYFREELTRFPKRSIKFLMEN